MKPHIFTDADDKQLLVAIAAIPTAKLLPLLVFLLIRAASNRSELVAKLKAL